MYVVMVHLKCGFIYIENGEEKCQQHTFHLSPIKTSWKMPTGYKLEGKLNMPTNSKGQVHLIVRQTKGEMDKQFPGDSNCE